MTATYYSIITDIGLAKHANASANSVNLDLTELAVGDSDGTYYNPDGTQVELQNELYRTDLTHVVLDDSNPNQLIIEAVINETVGPFYIREVGIFDADGALFAIGKFPETFKPNLPSGSGKRLYIRMILGFASTPNVNLILSDDINNDPNFSTHVNEELDNRLKKSENLADLNNVALARNNLGLGIAALAGNSAKNIRGISYLSNPILIKNNVSNPTNTIDFTEGNYNFDDLSGQLFVNAITKKAHQSWVAGNNNGGLFSGTFLPDKTYHCFEIYNPSTAIADAGFSNDINAADAPTGFTKKKRIGSIITSSTSTILGFKMRMLSHNSAYFIFNNVITAFGGGLPGQGTTLNLTTPIGLEVGAILSGVLGHSGAACWYNLRSKVEGGFVYVSAIGNIALARCHISSPPITTNTLGQIEHGFDPALGTSSVLLYLHGWIDYQL